MRSLFKIDSRGFTLIEVIICVAIMVIITTVVVLNQNTYQGDTQLVQVADDIALSIREAQVSAISVKEFQPGTNEFSDPYGIFFDKANAPTKYIVFADRPNGSITNGYDGNNANTCNTECVKQTALPAGYTVTNLCEELPAGSSPAERCNLGEVNVLFQRPSTQSNMTFQTNPGTYIHGNYTGTRIELTSPHNSVREVCVYITGRVNVQNQQGQCVQ